jgi:hypothetical protein
MRQFFCWDFIRKHFGSELIWAIYFWVSFSNKKFLEILPVLEKLMKITKWWKWLMKFSHKNNSQGEAEKEQIYWLIQPKKLWKIKWQTGDSITDNILLYCFLWTIPKLLKLFAQLSKKKHWKEKWNDSINKTRLFRQNSRKRKFLLISKIAKKRQENQEGNSVYFIFPLEFELWENSSIKAE